MSTLKVCEKTNSDLSLNPNSLVLGGVGSGKTKLCASKIMEADCNYIVLDFFGELFDSCVEKLEDAGYHVSVIGNNTENYNPNAHQKDLISEKDFAKLENKYGSLFDFNVTDEFDMTEWGCKKRAIFINFPTSDEKSAVKAMIVVSQLYSDLFHNKLNCRHTKFIFDELAFCTQLPFEVFATVRSKNISYFAVFQTVAQMKAWETKEHCNDGIVYANACYLYFLGAFDMKTIRFVASKVGLEAHDLEKLPSYQYIKYEKY